MITETESGLGTTEYTALPGNDRDISCMMVLQRYGPVWDQHPTVADWGYPGETPFDATETGGYLLRCYAASDGTVTVQRLDDESGGDETFQTIANSIADLSATVDPSIVGSGTAARIFYYSTDGKIRFSACADITSGTFGAGQDVDTIANVIAIAATSTTKVHFILKNGQSQRRLGYYEDDGGWSATYSDIYWPFPIFGFDAVALASYDLIMFASELPYILGSRVVGVTTTTEITRVQGLVTFREANAHWSDHDIVDPIDMVEVDPSRKNLRLCYENSWVFATYNRSSGADDYTYTYQYVSRSRDGINWEFPEVVSGSSDSPGVVIPRSDYLYHLTPDRTRRAPCCDWAGQTPIEQDLTERSASYRSQVASIRQSSLVLSNPDNVLADTLVTENDRLQMIYYLGYMSAGGISNLQVKVSTEDVIIRTQSDMLPRRTYSLNTACRLGRLNRVKSDFAAEWPSQTAGRDDFDDPTGTGHGGLRHSAPFEGNWDVEDNVLNLKAANKEGICITTFVESAMNGSMQTGIQCQTDDEGEYAGITFRYFDKDNLFYAAYFLDDDVVRVYERIGGSDTLLATSPALSWVKETWYYLKVVTYYAKFYVYTSTDGLNWANITWASGSNLIEGMNTGMTGAQRCWSGKFGVMGYGYSDEDTWPDYEPINPIPGPTMPINNTLERVVLITTAGVFYTDTFDQLSPVWYAANNGLSTGEKTSIIEGALDRSTGSVLYLINSSGAYKCPSVWDAGLWTQMQDNAAITTAFNAAGGACTPMGAWVPGFHSIAVERDASHIAMLCGGTTDGGCINHARAMWSDDGLVTISTSATSTFQDGAAYPTRCESQGPLMQVSSENGADLYSVTTGWSGQHGSSLRSINGGALVEDFQLLDDYMQWGSSSFHARTGTKSVMLFRGTGAVTTMWKMDTDGYPPNSAVTSPHAHALARYQVAINRYNTLNWIFLEDGGGTPHKTSDDGGTWGHLSVNPPGNIYCVANVSNDTVGNDGERFIFGGGRSARFVTYTPDFGETQLNKTGNLGTWLDDTAVTGDYVIQIIPYDA